LFPHSEGIFFMVNYLFSPWDFIAIITQSFLNKIYGLSSSLSVEHCLTENISLFSCSIPNSPFENLNSDRKLASCSFREEHELDY
jgi:hypothetical protein